MTRHERRDGKTRVKWAKRAMDLGVAVVVLLLTSPLWLVASLLVKITSAGPVFYYQRRIGHGGREFRMIKFRSMIVGGDPTSLAGSLDPRVTRVKVLSVEDSVGRRRRLQPGDLCQPQFDCVIDKITGDDIRALCRHNRVVILHPDVQDGRAVASSGGDNT